MSAMKAIVSDGNKQAVVVTDRPLPAPRPHFVRVKVKAVALNPTDWKHVYGAGLPAGHLFGCDFAGVVDEVGTGYTKEWKVGDRICGLAHGGNELNQEDGSFADYVMAKADVQLKIPTNMSFEDAATLGIATITCGQGLFSQWGLEMNWPDNPISDKKPVLIYGGSSAMGTFGIQLAKLAGYTVLTTCSPKNFELVKSLGADEVFDYKDPDCVAKIKKATNSNLTLVWDTISDNDTSVHICQKVITSGGIYASLGRTNADRDDITKRVTLGYFAMGEPVKKSFINLQKDDNTEDFNFAVKWIAVAEKLLAEGKLRTHPAKVGKGLEGVLDGLDQLKSGSVSGQKLVYTL